MISNLVLCRYPNSDPNLLIAFTCLSPLVFVRHGRAMEASACDDQVKLVRAREFLESRAIAEHPCNIHTTSHVARRATATQHTKPQALSPSEGAKNVRIEVPPIEGDFAAACMQQRAMDRANGVDLTPSPCCTLRSR